MVLVILLNFVIALISQSYECVMNKAVVHYYRQKSELNIECRMFWEFFITYPKVDCYVLVSDITDRHDES